MITRLMELILATIGTGMFLDGVGAEIAVFVKQIAYSASVQVKTNFEVLTRVSCGYPHIKPRDYARLT